MAEDTPHALSIDDVPEAKRYEARIEGRVAGWVDYRIHRGRLVATHTEVIPEFGGRGIGTRLVRHVIDDVRARGLALTPMCPLFVAYLEKHPEHRDLVRTAREPRTPPA